jgi:hypothetical protein
MPVFHCVYIYGWKIFPESLVTSRDCCSWRERGENQLDKFGHCMTLRLSPRNLQWGTGLELVSFIKCFRHKTLQLSLWIHRCRPPYQTLLGTNSSLYKACELSQYFHAVVEDGPETAISPLVAQRRRRLESCALKICAFSQPRLRKVSSFAGNEAAFSFLDSLMTSQSFE